MNQEMNDFIVKGLRELHCIRHRKPANVFINEEGFITITACCDDFHGFLYHAQDDLRAQYATAKEAADKAPNGR